MFLIWTLEGPLYKIARLGRRITENMCHNYILILKTCSPQGSGSQDQGFDLKFWLKSVDKTEAWFTVRARYHGYSDTAPFSSTTRGIDPMLL